MMDRHCEVRSNLFFSKQRNTKQRGMLCRKVIARYEAIYFFRSKEILKKRNAMSESHCEARSNLINLSVEK
jgi:hypothetical protein